LKFQILYIKRLQLIDNSEEDLQIPEVGFSFKTLIRAQALGDYQSLKRQGRRVLRINLKEDVNGNLSMLVELVHKQIELLKEERKN